MKFHKHKDTYVIPFYNSIRRHFIQAKQTIVLQSAKEKSVDNFVSKIRVALTGKSSIITAEMLFLEVTLTAKG